MVVMMMILLQWTTLHLVQASMVHFTRFPSRLRLYLHFLFSLSFPSHHFCRHIPHPQPSIPLLAVAVAFTEKLHNSCRQSNLRPMFGVRSEYIVCLPRKSKLR